MVYYLNNQNANVPCMWLTRRVAIDGILYKKILMTALMILIMVRLGQARQLNVQIMTVQQHAAVNKTVVS